MGREVLDFTGNFEFWVRKFWIGLPDEGMDYFSFPVAVSPCPVAVLFPF